ncbi:hypothetical protein CH333_07980 [candidate division WOR-3 bacterium JGI_Cruoil_03_44_89]|uniref:DUF202 domain-containing protein n=1 Tax=candidate division WOR-3 bacterium JGI_Cruoil_03_44_89 TaxID=1973748 RepID=A0A235BQD2_UNCW3|nr:MAG: hypothetical protein CH333_07980 [candidate division WOR-3 bacterium JGI_Cruoil_03_44_89]
METKLNKEEEGLVHELLTWDRTRRHIESIFCRLFLTLGGVIIVIVGFFTVQHLNDRIILWVTVPGFLIGLFLVGLYIEREHRLRERRLVASVLKKLCMDNKDK